MKTENELIAEFMGLMVFQEYSECQAVPIEKLTQWALVDQLEYHSKWDWLMPVVEKINSLIIEGEKIDVIIYRTTCHINDPRQILFEAIGNDMLECTYKAVVEFIKWYNQQKK